MPTVRECLQGTTNFLNGVSIVAGLGVVVVAAYFAFENAQNDLFGEFAVWVTWAPLSLGLAVLFTSSTACMLRIEYKKGGQLWYGLLCFSIGIVVLGAGAFQLSTITFLEEIAATEDLALLAAGPLGAMHNLADFDLGTYAKCCLGPEAAGQIGECIGENGGPICFRDDFWFDLGFGADAARCKHLAETLSFCPPAVPPVSFNEFTTNVLEFGDRKFSTAATALVLFGLTLLFNGLFAFFTGRYNHKNEHKLYTPQIH